MKRPPPRKLHKLEYEDSGWSTLRKLPFITFAIFAPLAYGAALLEGAGGNGHGGIPAWLFADVAAFPWAWLVYSHDMSHWALLLSLGVGILINLFVLYLVGWSTFGLGDSD